MKLEAGKWYRSGGGGKWHVDYVGNLCASAHDERGNVILLTLEGRGIGDGISVNFIAEWSEPKLRPWKMEEVPLGAWFQQKYNIGRLFWPTEVNEIGITLHGISNNYGYLFDYYQHSTDGGKTWLPCGVIE